MTTEEKLEVAFKLLDKMAFALFVDGQKFCPLCNNYVSDYGDCQHEASCAVGQWQWMRRRNPEQKS